MTSKEILDGVECWLDPESDIWCEECAFRKEIDANGCKAAVLRELRNLLKKEI